MKEIATNQAEIEAVTKLDEEHDFDLASNKESLLESAMSSHERVQAYLQNQIEAEHIPVVMETNLSPPKIDDPAPQVSVPALNQGNLNPETKPFVPTSPATVQQAKTQFPTQPFNLLPLNSIMILITILVTSLLFFGKPPPMQVF